MVREVSDFCVREENTRGDIVLVGRIEESERLLRERIVKGRGSVRYGKRIVADARYWID